MSLAERYGTGLVYHEYVYRRWEYLEAGRIYHFETRNLRNQQPTQPRPDPVMYLVRDDTIFARNDDYNGLASTIIYSPSETGYYYLIIRAWRTAAKGICDLYRGVDGAPPSRIARDMRFGGMKVYVRWKAGERFETRLDVPGGGGDTYLYLIEGDYVGGRLCRNDDGGIGLCSRIPLDHSGSGIVILGSYSRYSEGRCRLYNFYKSYMTPQYGSLL